MRLALHPGQVDPVIAVRAHHHRIAIVDLGEELALLAGNESADAGAQRRLHPVAHGEDLLLAKEGHVLGDGGIEAALVLLRAGHRRERRQAAVLFLLERQAGAGAGQLALHQGDLLGPGVRNELHMREIPVVVGDADP